MSHFANRAAVSAAFLIAALAGPLAALGAAAPRPDAPVLAIAPPWIDVDAVVARAGGRPIGPVGAPLATLAQGEGAHFAERLRDAGAWMVVDGAALARLCGAAA
jgi:hypothetical protein